MTTDGTRSAREAEFKRMLNLADAWGAGYMGDDPTGLDPDAYEAGAHAARVLDSYEKEGN